MSLNPIEKKLKGIYSNNKERNEREVSTSNLVQMLIQEATDLNNLVGLFRIIRFSYLMSLQSRMYPGWAPWH